MNICVLTSGGFDSTVLLGTALRAGHTVHPLYVRCGLAWERAELHWLRRSLREMRSPRLKPLTILNAPIKNLYDNHWSLTGRDVPGYRSRDEKVRLPGRNLLLLSNAAVFCAQRNLSSVYIGTLKGNPFSDASSRFFKTMERTAGLALGRRVSIRAPFRRLTKKQVLKRGKDLPLRFAFSCLSPGGLRPCGRCNKCAERDQALNP
jgi:7-cyano-7-deazaguanine synthase